MEVTTRHTPSFGVARIGLAGGEHMKVESGAMYAMSAGVTLESKMDGGFLKAAKRAVAGGESFFVSTYTAPSQGGFVDVAGPATWRSAHPRHPPDAAMFVSRGSWLASAAEVTLDTKWGGFKNLFGGEGGFILRASGVGTIVMACYGALETWDLQAGQSITVDTGHMVAYEETVQMSIRKAAGGMVQSFKSGEGLVFDFVGPGKVMTQTRNPTELVGWIQRPDRRRPAAVPVRVASSAASWVATDLPIGEGARRPPRSSRDYRHGAAAARPGGGLSGRGGPRDRGRHLPDEPAAIGEPRDRALRELAERRGWRYRDADPVGLGELRFRQFANAKHALVTNVLTTDQGRDGSVVRLLAACSSSTSRDGDGWLASSLADGVFGGETETVSRTTELVHETSKRRRRARRRVPCLRSTRDPGDVDHPAVEGAACADHDFESAEFNRQWDVRCGDERFAWLFCDASMIDTILQFGRGSTVGDIRELHVVDAASCWERQETSSASSRCSIACRRS